MNKIIKKIIGIYYYLYLWLYEIFKELISRILSIVFFPIAFIFQDKIRKHLYDINKELIIERTQTDTQKISTEAFYKKVNKLYFFLWMFLDDSTALDSYHKDGTPMYCASDNPKRYPKWIWNLDWYWLKATWWSFIRNNTVNFVSWHRTMGWKLKNTDTSYEFDLKEGKSVKTYWGEFNINIDKNDKNTKFVPGMYLVKVLHNNGKWYPYFTFIGEVFNHKIGIWQGWSKGSGRFSFAFRG